jgi:uncharacterized protein
MMKRVFIPVLTCMFVVIGIAKAELIAAANPPSLRPLAPAYVRSLKSRSSKIPATIKFTNHSGDPVGIYWVNYSGKLELYGHLAAGESNVIQTYVSHPWIVYDERTSAYIAGFLPQTGTADAVIKRPGTGEPAGAGFDCSRASSPAEKRICADPALAKMDRSAAELYRGVLQKGKDLDAWKTDQRAWLAERDRCKDDDGCLRAEYQERLLVLRATEAPAQWQGKWTRVDAGGNNGADLVITRATAKGFDFSLNAAAGGNSGELEGKAILDGSSKAHWKGTAQDSTEGCSLGFERVLNRLNIDQSGDSATCGAGFGVYFSGTYVAAGNSAKARPDLLALGVVKTPAQDDALRKLLGSDYDYMAQTAGSVNDDGENLDGNGAKVVSMFVPGVACDTKSLVMFDRDGHLWAAVWEPLSKPEDGVELRYYTNVTAGKNELPKTIAAGREACPGEKVRVRLMQ